MASSTPTLRPAPSRSGLRLGSILNNQINNFNNQTYILNNRTCMLNNLPETHKFIFLLTTIITFSIKTSAELLPGQIRQGLTPTSSYLVLSYFGHSSKGSQITLKNWFYWEEKENEADHVVAGPIKSRLSLATLSPLP